MYSLSHLRLVALKDGSAMDLAFLESWAGHGPSEQTVSLYSVGKRQVFYIRYSEQGDHNSTGTALVAADEANAAGEPDIRSWLKKLRA